jgi:hypothetical protein
MGYVQNLCNIPGIDGKTAYGVFSFSSSQHQNFRYIETVSLQKSAKSPGIGGNSACPPFLLCDCVVIPSLELSLREMSQPKKSVDEKRVRISHE